MSFRELAGVFGIAFISLLTSGCGPSKNPLGRLAVEGNVTLDGTPLDQGQIQFEPLEVQGKAVNGGASIANGAYKLPAEGGLVPGTYRVLISSVPQTQAAPATNDPIKTMEAASAASAAPPPADRIPAKYNKASELKADVKKDAPIKIDFSLESKG